MAKKPTAPVATSTNEVTSLFTQEHPVVQKAEKFEITKETLEDAALFLIEIKRASDAAEEEKRRALNLILALEKVERGRWKQFEDSIKKARAIMDRKILEYNEAVRQAAIKAKAALDAKIESGRLKNPEKIVAQMEAIKEPERRIFTGGGSLLEKDHKTVTIIDEKLIPREYLVPDMVKIRRDALAGVEIAGVEVTSEKRTSVTAF